MKYRLGVCSECSANYKVPASFEADRAKCKACGGVVELGSVQEDEPKPTAAPPMPARKVAPAATAPAAGAPAPKPAEKKGPSMKERLLAERRAAAEAEAQVARAKKPAAKPKARATGAAKPAARKAAPAARAKAGRADAEDTERPARGSKRGSARGGSSRRSAPAKSRRGGRGRGGDDEEEDDDGGRGGRRGGRRKQQGTNPMLLVVAGVMILIAAGAGFFLMNKSGDQAANDTVSAKGTGDDTTLTDVTNETDATPTDATNETDSTLTDVTNGTEDAPSTDASATDGADADATDAADTDATAADKPEDAPKKPAKEREFKDPASVDLLAIEDFGVPQGCTEERWAELQELGRVVMDPDAGAAGRRAGIKLVEEGKFAIPAILNEMKKLDLTDNFQFLTANAAQKTLTEICNGINLGWQYPDQEPDTWHYYDKKAIFNWCELWKVWDVDHDQFLRKTKRDKQPAKTPEPDEEEVGGEDDLDALDDI